MSEEEKPDNSKILKQVEKFLNSSNATDPQKKQALEELSKLSKDEIQKYLDKKKEDLAEAEAKDKLFRKEFVDKVKAETQFNDNQKENLLNGIEKLAVGDTEGFTELIKKYSTYMEESENKAKRPTEHDPSDTKSPKKKGLCFAGRVVDERPTEKPKSCYSDSRTAKAKKAEAEAKKTSKSK